MNFISLADKNQEAAWTLIRQLGVVEAWTSIGARINVVGSLKTGLLMKHLDIDFHVYTMPLSVEKSFTAMTDIARHPAVYHMTYSNEMQTDEHCLEWHCLCRDEEGRDWQLDIIHILEGSKYDGHFERVAERIVEVLTPECKKTILSLKAQTPDTEKIMGIEYCRAVIADGVRTWEELVQWRERQAGISWMDWMP